MFIIQTLLGALLLFVAYRAGLSLGLDPEVAGWSSFVLFLVFHLHMGAASVIERRRLYNLRKEEFLKEEERLRKLKKLLKK